MRVWLTLLLVVFVLGVDRPVAAGTDSGGAEFLFRLQGAVDSGDLTVEDALLHKFHYVFAPESLPVAYQVANTTPWKCATPLVQEFLAAQTELNVAATDEISTLLEPMTAQSVVLSSQGRFLFSYSLTGDHAVSAEDVDPSNGIPDYVERIGDYFEQAWESEIEAGEFMAPIAYEGPYPVSFQNMAAYGYTVAVDQTVGSTRIILHNNFEGFPQNDDPDGDRWGAAKVTAAHELRHASQYAASRWSEGGWIEMDAVWAEELVFDEVNDYYNFLPGESPLRRPDLSLDAGPTGSGSYEDAVFQIWLQQTWGLDIISDFWERRRASRSEAVLSSWEQVLADRNVSLAEGWALFTAWNYGTDQRAIPGVGYDEATRYLSGPAVPCSVIQPFTYSAAVEYLAAHPFRLDGFSEVEECGDADRLEIVLHAPLAAGPLTLAVHITRLDGSGLVETGILDGAGDLRYIVGVPWNEIKTAGVIVGNAATNGPPCAFDLSIGRLGDPDRVPVELDALSMAVQLLGPDTVVEYLTVTNLMAAGSDLDYTIEFCESDPRADVDSRTTSAFPSWLICDPVDGWLGGGDSMTLSLEFSSNGMTSGTAQGWLAVRADGYAEPVAIPVELAVSRLGGPLTGGAGLLQGSHPNPFNPSTWIHFELPAVAGVKVDVVDLRGRVVRRLLDETRDAGQHSVAWNGRDDAGAPLGAGLYLARLRTGGQQFTCKMILAK